MYAKTFLVPNRYHQHNVNNVSQAIIIPSHNPSPLTLTLLCQILDWNPGIHIYLVDDSTPIECQEGLRIFDTALKLFPQVMVIRTSSNKLKAGAINYGLNRLARCDTPLPDIIFTCDDDIWITPGTLTGMTRALMADDRLGAVCSQSWVTNKNQNLLTRLQALEYFGFNAARLTDEGFYQGPLVMHGMLTAFRTQALLGAGGFNEQSLIEDYEITTRLKEQGWHVRMARNALAWTTVPTKFSQLWKQRVRWTYGGLTVLAKCRHWPSIIQDVFGHVLFFGTLAAIAIFFLFPFSINGFHGSWPRLLGRIIILLSLAQFMISYLFQVWILRYYHEKDKWDWFLRLSILPEFIYANILSLVLIGSYVFFTFNALSRRLSVSATGLGIFIRLVRSGFKKIGFTETWGTRVA